MGYIVGVDIGTSSTKAVLFDSDGRQIARCAQRYVLNSPVSGAAEQDANEILRATTRTVTNVLATRGMASSQLPKALLGVSFSAAMHTLLLIDKANQPITPLYTWADNRSDRWAQFVGKQDGQLYQRTGMGPYPMSPVVKLVWLRHEQPAIFARAARVVSIKEYVLHHWCDRWVIDHAIAAATGLLNLASLTWDAGAIALAGITPDHLSELVPTTHRLAMQPAQAKAMGILASTPVIVGASDGVLANLGVGAIAPGTAAITLGTSGAVRQVVNQPVTANLKTNLKAHETAHETARETARETAQLFCYPLTKDHWVVGGAVNNGGIALQWARDSLLASACEQITYEQMSVMAAAIAPGADGLIFHPHLLGARAPLWDAQARANFFGLGIHHTQAHLVRAVMEGVLYNLQSVFGVLESVGGNVTTLRASGGFAQSALWQQMLADIFNREILVPAVIESSAFGAAVLALVTLGEWSDLEQVEARVDVAFTRQPIAKNVNRYQKLLPIYAELLAGFRHQYAALQQALKDS